MNARRRMTLLPVAMAGLALATQLGCSTAPAGAIDLGPAEPAPPRPDPDRAPAVALVLSSGGLRGLAQVGVVQVLAAEGLWPDLVVGTSIGALIGACCACGLDPARLAASDPPSVLDPWGSWWVGPTARGRAFEQWVAATLGRRRIETFPRRFVAMWTARWPRRCRCGSPVPWARSAWWPSTPRSTPNPWCPTGSSTPFFARGW